MPCNNILINYDHSNRDRLRRRFREAKAKNKPVNIVCTAIARELAGFVWGMMTGNIK